MFKKKTENATDTKDAGSPGWAPDPRKAAKFFEHAKATHESTNYQYAMQLWLQGLKHEPENMDALDAFFRSATAFAGESKKGPDRSVSKALEGKEPTAKYALALLETGVKPLDVGNAIKAFEVTTKLSFGEPGYLLGERAMAVASRDKKPKKDVWVKLMDLFAAIGVFDLATRCGERAMQIDPSDGPLSNKVRNMSAEATISNAGFSDGKVEQGAFKKNIRNIEQQQKLDEEERLAKDSTTHERLIERAEEDHRSRPDDIPAAEQLIRRLLDRGEDKDEIRAYQVAKESFDRTGKTGFKVTAGDINLRQAKRKVRSIEDQARTTPDDEKLARTVASARAKLLDMEHKEFEWRVKEFPSDMSYKLELSRRMVAKGEHERAIPLLQKAKSDAKLRPESLRLLGECFSAIGYLDEAIDFTREALKIHGDPHDLRGLSLQYDLVGLLTRQAQESRELSSATEADTIASKIMQQDFGYRDIKSKRDELKALIAELRS